MSLYLFIASVFTHDSIKKTKKQSHSTFRRIPRKLLKIVTRFFAQTSALVNHLLKQSSNRIFQRIQICCLVVTCSARWITLPTLCIVYSIYTCIDGESAVNTTTGSDADTRRTSAGLQGRRRSSLTSLIDSSLYSIAEQDEEH